MTAKKFADSFLQPTYVLVRKSSGHCLFCFVLIVLLCLQVVGDLSARSKDRVLSLGERLACKIVAAALTIKEGIPARVINLDNIVAEVFGGSLPEQESQFERLGTEFYHRLWRRIGSVVSESTDAVPVITGMYTLLDDV